MSVSLTHGLCSRGLSCFSLLFSLSDPMSAYVQSVPTSFCLCTFCSLHLHQRTGASSCSMPVPLLLHCPCFFLKKIHTLEHNCRPGLFLALLPLARLSILCHCSFYCFLVYPSSQLETIHPPDHVCCLLVVFSLDVKVCEGVSP